MSGSEHIDPRGTWFARRDEGAVDDTPIGPDPWESRAGRFARRLIVVAAAVAWVAASAWAIMILTSSSFAGESARRHPQHVEAVAMLMLALFLPPLVTALSVSLASGKASPTGDVVALAATVAGAALGIELVRGAFDAAVGLGSQKVVSGRGSAGLYAAALVCGVLGALFRLVAGRKAPDQPD